MSRIIYDASFLERFTPEQDGVEPELAEMGAILCEEQGLGVRVIWAEPAQYGHDQPGAIVYQICDATTGVVAIAFDYFSEVIEWLED